MENEDKQESILANHAIKDDFEKRHAYDLSASKYAQKKGLELALTATGAGVGFIAGKYGIHKLPIKAFPKSLRELVENDPEMRREFEFPASLMGSAIGMSVGTVPIAYEHWRKEEAKRFAVQEMNQDVANAKIRTRTDPELVEENIRLRQMLEEKAAQTEALLSAKKQIVDDLTDSHLGKEKKKPTSKISTNGHELAEQALHAVAEVATHSLGH